MAGMIDAKLADLGITVPTPATPLANYIGYNQVGSLVIVSGQIPLVDGKVAITGKLGAGVSVEQGQQAARICFINLLAQVKLACGGDLDRVKRVVRLGGFVACTPDFTQQPAAVVPCGFSPGGLPVGLQIVGARYADALVMRAARAFEAVAPFRMPRA